MTVLSSEIGDMQGRYDFVIVGSGYGGSVAASRLARARKPDGTTAATVCLLERGREIHAGQFPKTNAGALEEMHEVGPQPLGVKSDGLYRVHFDDDVVVVSGCGLGGTSLINASVGIEADPRIFDDVRWPAAFRASVGTELAAGADEARRMLDLQTFPSDEQKPAKLVALEKAAAANGWPCYKASLAVNFAEHDDEINHVGVKQYQCLMCGDCVSGCNAGAKSTLTMNYLPDARQHGAQIVCGVDVRRVEKTPQGWRVYYRPTGQALPGDALPWVDAGNVILAAGTLGTTEILLRSSQHGVELSDKLGRRLTANGDYVAFAYNCDDEMHGIGWGNLPDTNHPTAGPCITGVIDTRKREANVDHGMIIEDGSVPGVLARLVAFGLLAKGGAPRSVAAALRVAESCQRDGERRGAVDHSLLYLVMSHDDASGSMGLVNDRLSISWPNMSNNPAFERVRARLEATTHPLNGVFLERPIWEDVLGHRAVSVHPLGGCVMAESAEDGVVNHRGQVFQGASGSAVHENLYVMDGAVIPRPLGVNPLLTITSIAERNVALLIGDQGWKIDYAFPNAPLAPPPAPKPPIGLRFSEHMSGWVSKPPPDVPTRYERGYEKGKTAGTALSFTVTIESYCLDDLLDPRKRHNAVITGTARAPWLSPTPLRVRNGVFNLFVVDPDQVETCHMIYRMRLEADDGSVYFLDGFKIVKHDDLTEVYDATTTLFVTLHEGRDDTGPVVAEGILQIAPADLTAMTASIQVTHAPDAREAMKAEARFARYFAGVVWEHYGGNPMPSAPGIPRSSTFQPPLPVLELHRFKTSDQVELSFSRYRGGVKGPLILAGGFGMSSLAWHVDTLDPSFAQYMAAQGYDVWCFDYRASPLLDSARTQFTVDDIAVRDWPAAVEYVKTATGRDSVQILGHCVGSMSILMGLCAGKVQGVRTLVCSQTTLHLDVPGRAKAEALVYLPEVFRRGGIDVLSTTPGVGHAERAIDFLLRAFPVPDAEKCSSPVCHRIFALYGNVYKHVQLNQATHEAMGDMFGTANVGTFLHLTRMIREGHVVDAHGWDSYLPFLHRLKLPITFLVGRENTFFYPSGARATYQELVDSNGPGNYSYVSIPGYGHLDCFIGKNASREVWPAVLRAFDKYP